MGMLLRALLIGGLAGALALPPGTAYAQPPRDSERCAKPATPGTVVRELESGGERRSYRLHVPEHYGAGERLPLVLAFHGRGSSGAELESYSNLSALPALVVYPEGQLSDGKQSWQGAPYEPEGDDVAFVEDLLAELQGAYCVDAQRIYATGKSNGGGFTGLLACRLDRRIAAFAVVAGAFYAESQEGCETSRAVPMLEFHGTADQTMRYEGGVRNGGAYAAVPDWLAGWTAKSRCRAGVTEQIGEDVRRTRWRACHRKASVEHYAVLGGGHTWPGATEYSGGGATTQTIRASEVMWEFFRRHRLT